MIFTCGEICSVATKQESIFPTQFNSRLKIAHVMLFPIVSLNKKVKKRKKNQLQYVDVAKQ